MLTDRPSDARTGKSHSANATERLYRISWVAAELRSPSGVPLLQPQDVARLGHAARTIDIRRAEELTGPHGHIPGSDWLPQDEAVALLGNEPKDRPLILVSRGGERAGEIALALEKMGFRFVAALMGGIVAWRQMGYAVVRDSRILSRRGMLSAVHDNFSPRTRKPTVADIEEHLGDPTAIHWIKLAALLVNGHLSCVDGRDGSGVLGTPGGDAGELLVTLAAIEHVTDLRFDDAEVARLLYSRLDAFGRLYMHTDLISSNALTISMRSDPRLEAALAGVSGPMEWRAFWQKPPENVQTALFDHLLMPEHIGCGHLRLSVLQPDEYGVRTALVESFIRQFFLMRWQGIPEHVVTVLPGGHAEGAVVSITIPGAVEAFSSVPLVSPMTAGNQMFLHHPQVAAYLRQQMLRFLATREPIDVAKVSPELERLAERQLGHTLKNLALGLPVFSAVLERDRATVTECGVVS